MDEITKTIVMEALKEINKIAKILNTPSVEESVNGQRKSAIKKRTKKIREKNQANLERMKELRAQLKEKESLKKLLLEKKTPRQNIA